MACLERFMSAAEAMRFQPGAWDCCLMPANWVRDVTGIDGAAPWRGRYATRRGYLRHLKAGGGVTGVMTRGAEIAGLSETGEPRRGDIGVVESGTGPVGAICLGRRWATVGRNGIVVLPGPALKAWSVARG